jgi:hypothetical protein
MSSLLADLISQRGALSAPDATTIARAIAQALTETHAAGSVHGRLTTGDVVMAGDVATLLPPHEQVDVDLLPPEVRSGLPPVFSADLWSLGRIIQAMVGSEAGSLAPLVAQLTSENPWDRPMSAAIVVTQLDDLLDPQPVIAPLVPSPESVAAIEAMPPVPTDTPAQIADLPSEEAPAAPPEPSVLLLPEPEVVTVALPEPRRRTGLVVGAVAAAVALIAGGAVLARSSGGSTKVKLASATTLSLGFDPEQYPSGLVSSARWTLSGGQGDTLTANVVLTNTNATLLITTYDVVIPKSIATSAKDLEFQPVPDKVIKDDPVVRFNVHLPPSGTLSIGYRSTVPATGLSQVRLDDWMADLTKAEATELAIKPVVISLASLTISTGTLSLAAGDTQQLAVMGTSTSGQPASGALLAGTAWTSSNPAVATVDQAGNVLGTGAGTSQISAQVGKLRASIPVTVTASTSGFTPPAKPNQAPPPIVAPPVVTHPAAHPATHPATGPTSGSKPTPTQAANLTPASPTPSPTPMGQPPTITNVSAHPSGDRAVLVHWNASDNGGGTSNCQVNIGGATRWSGPCSAGPGPGATVSGLAYSTNYTVQVIGSNARGTSAGPSTQVQTNDAPSSQHLTVSKGAHYQTSNCTNSSCAWLYVSASGFAANTSYTITCYSSNQGSFYTYAQATDASGNLTSTNRCYYGYPGQQVWVTMGGVESNHYTWS